jgi:hypothetical protein
VLLIRLTHDRVQGSDIGVIHFAVLQGIRKVFCYVREHLIEANSQLSSWGNSFCMASALHLVVTSISEGAIKPRTNTHSFGTWLT